MEVERAVSKHMHDGLTCQAGRAIRRILKDIHCTSEHGPYVRWYHVSHHDVTVVSQHPGNAAGQQSSTVKWDKEVGQQSRMHRRYRRDSKLQGLSQSCVAHIPGATHVLQQELTMVAKVPIWSCTYLAHQEQHIRSKKNP